MIMTMIAHVLSVKRTESIVITGMHNFVVHFVGGKMVVKNHHGVMIVTLWIFRGDSMKSLVILFIGLSVIVLAEGMILAELFGFNRLVTGLLFAVGGGFCFWYWIRQINWVKNE